MLANEVDVCFVLMRGCISMIDIRAAMRGLHAGVCGGLGYD